MLNLTNTTYSGELTESKSPMQPLDTFDIRKLLSSAIGRRVSLYRLQALFWKEFLSLCVKQKAFFNPEMEAVLSSKALVPVHKTTWRHSTEDVN